MNEVEFLGRDMLVDFLQMTNKYMLCYRGKDLGTLDVPLPVQGAVRAIVKEYLNVHYAEISNAEDD